MAGFRVEFWIGDGEPRRIRIHGCEVGDLDAPSVIVRNYGFETAIVRINGVDYVVPPAYRVETGVPGVLETHTGYVFVLLPKSLEYVVQRLQGGEIGAEFDIGLFGEYDIRIQHDGGQYIMYARNVDVYLTPLYTVSYKGAYQPPTIPTEEELRERVSAVKPTPMPQPVPVPPEAVAPVPVPTPAVAPEMQPQPVPAPPQAVTPVPLKPPKPWWLAKIEELIEELMRELENLLRW